MALFMTAFAHLRSIVAAWLNAPLKRSGVHLATLALAVLTISLLINFINQVMQSANLEARRTTLATEVAMHESENAHIRGAVEYAESDVYVERVAREQLGYAREGDMVVLPQFQAATPTATPEAHAATTPSRPITTPNWQRWWQAFAPDDDV